MKNSGAVLLVAVMLLTFAPAGAEDLSHIPGAFVDIGYGARPMGMGGAFVGLADDRNAVMWNPAGLLKSDGYGISMMWAKQLGFVPYNYFSFSMPVKETYRLGAGAIYSGDDLMSETTLLVSFASPLGQFSNYLNGFAVAANLKFRSSSFGNNEDGDADRVTGDANGYGLDLGFMWTPDNRTSFGLFFRDLLNDMNWNSSVSGKYSEAVPAEMTLGVSHWFTPTTVVAADMRKALYKDIDDRIMLGVEQKVFKMIFIRSGWGQNIGAEYPNQEIAFGAGVEEQYKNFYFSFDLAYMLNDLKNTPRAGASINW